MSSHNKQNITISPSKLFTLFISFEDDKGSDIYRYLFYMYRIAYIFIQKSAFIPTVYESEKSFKIFYKPIFSLEVVKIQIEYLSNIAPPFASFNKKEMTQKSQTELMLLAILTDLIPHFNFMHKKEKNNPPRISYTFFQAQVYKVVDFEDRHLALTIKNYFAIFEIIQSDYKYKLFIDKDKSNYTLSLKVEELSSLKMLTLQKSLEFFNKMHIARFVSFLQNFLPQIALLLQKEKIALNQEILEEFLLKTATIITNLGVEVILPKELKNLLKPKLSLKASKSSKSLKSFFTLDGILEYDWQIAIGDEYISISEFEKLLENANELIAFKDNFVVISAEEVKALFAQVNRKTKLNKFDILQAKLSGDAEFDIDLDNFFEQMLSVENIAPPKTLKANLREYQQRGFEWSINNLLNGFGTILADDMGLG
jgi:SNF2 family DNA or RNA helicase